MTAKEFSEEAHKDQEEVLSDVRVVYGLTQIDGENNTAGEIARLHKLYAFTSVDQKTVVEMFGPRIAIALNLISEPKKETRAERARCENIILASIKPENEDALVVKVACKTRDWWKAIAKADMPELELLTNEHMDFCKAVYRKGLAPKLWDAFLSAATSGAKRVRGVQAVPGTAIIRRTGREGVKPIVVT